jgi:endoglucanase
MKKTTLIALGLLAAAMTSASSAAVIDSPVMFGVNLSGAEFGSSSQGQIPGSLGYHYSYPTANDFDWAKSYGQELIRFPIRWERIQRTLNGALDATEMARVDAVLKLAEDRGMRVILDLHNFGQYVTGTTGYKIGTTQVPLSAFQNVWGQLANRYKSRTCIWGYDIMNEPAIPIDTWVGYAQAVVNTIRLYDTSHAIILEGEGSSKASTWAIHGARLIEVTDSANNLIYSAHCYPDRDASGTWRNGVTMAAELPAASYPQPLLVGVNRLKPFADWCVANNVRGLLGEYASLHTTDVANWNTILQNMLNDIQNRNLAGARISATQWGAGERWDAGTVYKMQPMVNAADPLFMNIVDNYVTSAGTDYASPFYLFGDQIVPGTTSSIYKWTSPSPYLATMTATIDTAVRYNGTSSFKMTYAIPAGGYAGAGMHINGGLAFQKNFAAKNVLSFYAKGTAGAHFSFTFGNANDTVTGNWISTNSIVPLDGTWRKYQVPLSSFVNAQLTGTTVVGRLRFNAGPSNGSTHVVNIDNIRIDPDPADVAPVVTVNTSTGGTSFAAGQSVTLVATATDANAGHTIDYVEFFANERKVGIDATAPFQVATSFASAGTYSLKAVAVTSPTGKSGVSALKNITITAGGGATAASFESVAAEDGYVVESTEASNVGGTLSSSTTIQVGDTATRQQVKGILSFDTSSIPDGATILSATLRLRRASVTGTNPFTTHGACNVSIKTGGYSGNNNLVTGDFSAVDTATNVGMVSDPTAAGASAAALTSAGRSAINKTGVTQFRLAFVSDDDNDASTDITAFYSGNEATVANRPVLEISYQ